MDDRDYPALDAITPYCAGVPPFDPAEFMEYVDDPNLTEAQKVEFLRNLWNIMSAFVELGFGVDSVIPALVEKASENAPCTLEKAIPTHEFNIAVDDQSQEED